MRPPKQQNPALPRAMERAEVALNKISPNRQLLGDKTSASLC